MVARARQKLPLSQSWWSGNQPGARHAREAELKTLTYHLLSLTWVIANLPVALSAADQSHRWITTWSTANAASERPTEFSNQTIREVVHTTIGGSAVRLRLANTFGPHAIRFDAVFVGVQQTGAALVRGSNHRVTFGGSHSIEISEGAEVLSDPVSLAVSSARNLTISLFTPDR